MNRAQTQTALSAFDVRVIRKDFPQLSETAIHGKPLTYLDNAATTLKPLPVIEAILRYYRREAANIHRGVHTLSEHGTALYEETRAKMQRFINAKHVEEIIFTKGATEAINLVSRSYGDSFLKSGDEIVLSTLEHHSNIVPWQLLCERVGAHLKIIPITDEGAIIIPEYERLLNEKTKIVAIAAIANAIGTVNPIKEMVASAHRHNAIFVVDAAQAAAHRKLDVQDLDCDFLALSGHKMFGPTGIGILYGKKELLEKMPPFLGGGDMIDTVTFAKTTYNVVPHKFEAGTPQIASAIGLGPAIDYIQGLGLEKIAAHEEALRAYATKRLEEIDGVRLLGTAQEKAAIVNFVIKDVHPQDVATLIDMEGVAIRTGHHCAQPLMQFFGVTSSCRASFSVYNTREDIDVFIAALKKAKGLL